MTDEQRDRGLHRHNDPPKGEEAKAVTGRPNDLGSHTPPEALPNSTLASRAGKKQVNASDVEDKAITKAPAKKAARRG